MQTFLHYRWRVPSTLHRLHPRRIIPLLLLALCVTGAKAANVPTSWKDVTFNGDIRYSQWVINSRIRDFRAKDTKRGFNTYYENGTQKGSSEGTQAFDYVPGLVAKAVLEAYANYKDFDWSKPWFYSVMNYAKDNTYELVATSKATDFSKITLDDMNACKMYFPLMETGALSDGAKSTGETAITNVLTDMRKYNELYVIGNGSESGVKGSTNEKVKSMFGGWFHKPSYKDQMWCDGLYMGAALLAQIVNYTKSATNVDGTSDWDLITKQFTISWNQLYNSEKGLLYHAFTANPKDEASSKWAGISNTEGAEVYHSEAFWGRAMGWYFLALVDVLEQMPSNNSNRATLIDYLEKLAAGLAKYQDAETGCWYQVIDEKDTHLDGNYLESSCTSLFAAAYLKAVRLGFLTSNGTYDYKTIGVNAFKGAVNQFMKYDTFEPTGTTVQLVHNCASAGLGGTNGRTGSRQYYITGSDVGQTNTYTEGKVMGAFIMAATEYERAPENQKDIRFSYDLAPSYTLAQGDFIKVEALGSGAGTATYQWYKTTDGTTGTAVTGATTATFSPTESGSYYCEAKSGSTTIKTSPTVVRVEGTDGIENGGTETSKDIFSLTVTYNQVYSLASGADLNLTYAYATVTGGSALVHNGKSDPAEIIYLKNNNTSGNIALNGSSATYVKLTLDTPLQEGDVITFTSDENSIGSFYLTTTSTKNMNCSTTGGTYTVTSSDGLVDKTALYVWNNSEGKFKSITITRTGPSISITTQPTGATYDVNAPSVTPLSVTVTGAETITYQWYKNTTNSTEGGTQITTNGTSYYYEPDVTTAGTTYYYCIATAGGQSVTSDVVAVAVLNASDLKTKYNAAWTPIANGTIEVGNLVTSSSKGAYSITTGNDDVATISGTTITALKAGTFTLSQAADDKYKAGSREITVRIGQDVTSDGSNAYSFPAETNVSDGMTIARKDITMTFGNDGFWSKPSTNSYTGGQVNPAVSNNIPTKGTFYKFNATTTGSLKVKVKLGHDGKGKLRPLYVSENGTLIKAKDKDGTVLDPTNMPAANGNYDGEITFPVKANTDYYVYVTGSKLGFYNFTFEPATLYTVTFNAGSNGTCETPSLIQTSEGASITLPSVTANAGYTFDGWYTAETGGTKEGDAGATYSPSTDITLYARYTATSTGATIIYFPADNNTTSNTAVLTVTGGNMKSNPGDVTYKSKKYSYALKFDSSASVILKLSAESNVVLVFNPSNSGRTITVGGTSYTIDADGLVSISSLAAGQYTIQKGDTETDLYAVDIQPTGPSLSFTIQPSNKDYAQGVSVSLTVAASVSNDTNREYGNVTYLWYSNTTESNQNGTLLEGETEATYSPSTAELGTIYYYCVATAAKTADASQKLTATSNVAVVTVSKPSIEFTTQPQGAVYTKSETENAAALTVAATTNFKGTVTYQWYSNTTGKIPTTPDDLAKAKLSDATSYSYIPSIKTTGKTYYYCIATSEYNSNSYTAASDIVCIEVVTALYSYNVKGKDKPKCNESRWIEDGNSNKLVKFTFGGWKYNNNKYLKPNADDIDANYITDEWSAPSQQAKVNALDGYEYAISGKYDAVQENKAEKTTMYQKDRYGWFQSPTRDDAGVTTASHPYTLPVRGAYMTFEPTMNGTLTIYLLQNGAWNSDTNNNIDIKPGEFRMHAFQVTNQRGLVLEEFAPKYSITTNQKVADGYSCTNYENKPTTFDKTSKDISQWEEFWALTDKERKAVHDNWNNGTNGSQTIIKLDNGSFLAIQKAIVKYEFHVTGNETYYLFSNFSKLGFAGAAFQPDGESGQPKDETTFSGINSLSDTKAFTQIKATATDEKIPGTKLTQYLFTIGDKEVGKVDGVFIPQFKAITLDRTFKKDQWTTLTLPFNLTQTEVEQIFGKGTEILVFKDAITTNRTKLHIKFIYHEIQNILPGYPYLIKPTLKDDKGNAMTTKGTSTDNAPIYTIDNTESENPILKSFTVYGKAINPHIKQYEFKSKDNQYVAKGTPGYCKDENGDIRKKYEEGDLFISEGDGKLYISQGLSYGNGYRSYIDYTGTETSSAATKTLSLTFSGVDDGEGDGTTTEISVAELADDVIEAFGIKGVYNLNGQKVAETTRNLPAGIYVVNGRKVVVK